MYENMEIYICIPVFLYLYVKNIVEIGEADYMNYDYMTTTIWLYDSYYVNWKQVLKNEEGNIEKSKSSRT